MAGPATLRLRISRDAERQVRGGHPWIYENSIRSISDGGDVGQLGVVYDRNNRFLAIGLHDPDSPITLRVLASGKPATIDGAFWQARIGEACERRRELIDDGQTDGFRVINGESDGFPGLVADLYAGTLVLKIYTRAWEPWLDQLVPVFQQRLDPGRILLRRSRNAARDGDGSGEAELVAGPPIEGAVVFRENGLRFEAEVGSGQKTGFFLDQRDNRQRVRGMAQGKAVLNLFSFSGAFSVAAAAGGARAVTDVDISRHALASGDRNYALNEEVVGSCRRGAIKADVFEWLREPSGETYGIVIVDPPSLAQRAADRDRAVQAYFRLNRAAADRVQKGGVLVAASCSAHVDADTFFATVRRAAGSGWDEIETTAHAIDHPATIPEAHYLKAIFLRRT